MYLSISIVKYTIMLDSLFGSKTRVAVLRAFFLDETKASSSLQDMVRHTGLDPASVLRELVHLVEIGLLIEEGERRQKTYRLNKTRKIVPGLRSLFSAEGASTDAKSFFLFEEFYGYTPQQTVDFLNVQKSNELLEEVGLSARITASLTVYRDSLWKIYFIKQEFDAISREIVDRITSHPEFFLDFEKVLRARADALVVESRRIAETNLSTLTNAQLLKLYRSAFRVYEQAHLSGWPQNAADFGEGMLTKYLSRYLKTLIGKKVSFKVNDVFVKLTTPTEESLAQQEWKHLIQLYAAIQRREKMKQLFASTDTRMIEASLAQLDPKLSAQLDEHVAAYGHLGWGVSGPVWGRAYFIDILASLARQKKTVESLESEVETSGRELAKEQKRLPQELGMDALHEQIFAVARGLAFTKGYRKDAIFFHWSIIDHVHREIARRFYYSLKQVRFMHPREVEMVLQGEKIDAQSINSRPVLSAFYSTGSYETDKIVVGREVEPFLQRLSFEAEQSLSLSELQGECASPGRVRGICRIVNTPADMAKMGQGDILVSFATSPDLIPAIKKAAAIITNSGGITCHAAIISRELAIPCVIGTKHATRVLHDGDLVDVDAGHGKVVILKQ